MKEEKKIQQSDIDDAKVRLKPIAGISPLVYLPFIYGLAACFVFFVIFLYPGIRSRGSYLAFDGSPSTCAVYLDGNYRGSTARKFFVKAGSYAMSVEKEGYTASTKQVVVGGRLFASLFFPKISRFTYGLSAIDGAKNIQRAYAEYSSWSLTGKPSTLYQVPVILSEAVADYFRSEEKVKAKASPFPFAVSDFISDIAAATQSSELARDGLRASVLLASGGSPSPLGLAAAARSALDVLGKDAVGGIWLKDLILKKSKKTADLLQKLPSPKPQALKPAPKPQNFVNLGPQQYLIFSAGYAAMGGEAPSGSLAFYSRKVPSFGMARTEVTKGQWASFLAASPEWKLENRSALAENGFIDDNYLASFNSGSPDEPITGVSWYAAMAYCAWLTKTSGGAYAVTLPSEAMWETAAAASLSDPSSLKEKKAVWASKEATGPSRVASLGYSSIGLADLFGNVWEWSADSYLPYPAFARGSGSDGASEFLAGPEKAVRGGSWANTADKTDLHSRGGLSPSRSSSFLGFRTAIVQR
ncbi:MAG: SUMF1/EgtB/PvdO family nonheme iron enzyme [Spirochaetes bacterium]|nr:SUMF1/EgtB/PvdO family nonheme iron enzyme [Spirochaetota bacterium]